VVVFLRAFYAEVGALFVTVTERWVEMAREMSRIQLGHFRTQPRIIQALSKLIRPAAEGNISVLDCCCGTGEAVAELKQAWGSPANVKTYGIEVDKGRAEQAEKNLDEVLWGAIEDSHPSANTSLCYANLPYDVVRGEGRLELILFDKIKDWTMRKKGILVLILPKAVLIERWSELAMAIERHYTVDPFDYPEPEAQDYGQAVLVCRRREKENTSYDTPGWTTTIWPTLPLEAEHPRWTLAPSASVSLRRIEVSDAVLLEAVAKSPLRFAMIRESLAAEPPLARPALKLRPGHTALLLAGGLLDTMLDDPVHGKFLIKGMLKVSTRKVKTEEKLDESGNVCAIVDYLRTHYALRVTALRNTGAVEKYSSEELDTELEGGMVTSGEVEEKGHRTGPTYRKPSSAL
jgi:SAM-dependent methyltransferase